MKTRSCLVTWAPARKGKPDSAFGFINIIIEGVCDGSHAPAYAGRSNKSLPNYTHAYTMCYIQAAKRFQKNFFFGIREI